MKKINWSKLIIALAIPQIAGLIGSFFNFQSIDDWYQMLNKPSFNPPSWVFAPAWTSLFILMGIALYLVWTKQSDQEKKQKALFFWGAQMILNVVWSFLFFYLQNPGLALIEIIILWLSILLTMIYFYKISKPATWLLLPYILWVSFATVLNFAIYYLNI